MWFFYEILGHKFFSVDKKLYETAHFLHSLKKQISTGMQNFVRIMAWISKNSDTASLAFCILLISKHFLLQLADTKWYYSKLNLYWVSKLMQGDFSVG